jgi:signal transduction histidine kinase
MPPIVRTCFVFLICLHIGTTGLAQSGEEQGISIYPAPNNGIYFAGRYDAGNGSFYQRPNQESDLFLARYTEKGKRLWLKTFSGAQGDFVTASLAPLPDGAFLISGHTDSQQGDIAGIHGDADIFVIKCDANGEVLWKKYYGGSSWDVCNSTSPARDTGFFITGTAESNDGDFSNLLRQSREGYIIRCDKKGNRLWSRMFTGPMYEEVFSCTELPDGNLLAVLITTATTGPYACPGLNENIVLLLLDPNGKTLKQQCMSSDGYEFLRMGCPGPNGNYFFAGNTFIPDTSVKNTFPDLWTFMIDSQLNVLWQKHFPDKFNTRCEFVRSCPDGSGFLVLGNSNGSLTPQQNNWQQKQSQDSYLAKFDLKGNLIWSRNYGGAADDHMQYLFMQPDGTSYMAGWTRSTDGMLNQKRNTSLDAWIVKVDSYGTPLWQDVIGGWNLEDELEYNEAALRMFGSPTHEAYYLYYSNIIMFLLASAAGVLIYFLWRSRKRQKAKLHLLRANLSQDLHDNFGSDMSALALSAQSAARSGDPERMTATLLKLSDYSTRITEDMQDIVWALNPENDRGQKLKQRMQAYASHIFEDMDILVSISASPEIEKLKLEAEARKQVYLFYKEALTNAVKHAKTTHIQVSILIENNQFELNIRDQGCGFNMKEIANPSRLGGNGLESLRRRSRILGGQLEIQSKPGVGTNVRLLVPLV